MEHVGRSSAVALDFRLQLIEGKAQVQTRLICASLIAVSTLNFKCSH
jgi:hypothetical protein